MFTACRCSKKSFPTPTVSAHILIHTFEFDFIKHLQTKALKSETFKTISLSAAIKLHKVPQLDNYNTVSYVPVLILLQ